MTRCYGHMSYFDYDTYTFLLCVYGMLGKNVTGERVYLHVYPRKKIVAVGLFITTKACDEVRRYTTEKTQK